ncbi:hypothetical protein DYB30_001189 [Aphanomyces astaci]|uniref:Uncharacterized protein n=2 Tax=Aphanomyces astaci TaxID=112090 RepID=A0A397CA51_APHAT|nr:hypothetical protein DYB30_001189 [Aphanomyces astaci]
MTLENMGMSKGKTLAALDDDPVDLPKLIAQETKKFKYRTVVNLVKSVESVIMTMFTTDSEGVLSELRASRKCLPLFFQIVCNMPKTKSFHFQALLVEIVYRILRMLRKSTIKKDQELTKKILESLPPILSQGIQSVTPKVEIAINIADEVVQGIAKIHCSNIDGFATEGMSAIKLHINKSVSLADVAPNVNDSEWGDIHGLVAVLRVDSANIVPTLKLRFKKIEKEVATTSIAVETQSKLSTAAESSKAFYKLMADAKTKQKPHESARPQPSGLTAANRATKKQEAATVTSRAIKAEGIKEANFVPATKTKQDHPKGTQRKRAADRPVPKQTPSVQIPPRQAAESKPSRIKRERQDDQTWDFERTDTRPKNAYKKQKSQKATVETSSTTTTTAKSPPVNRSRMALSKPAKAAASIPAHAWKQELITQHDAPQSHRFTFNPSKSVEDDAKEIQRAKQPRATTLTTKSSSTNSRRPASDKFAMRKPSQEKVVPPPEINSSSVDASARFAVPLKSSHDEPDHRGGFKSKPYEGTNGLHAVIESLDNFSSEIKHQQMEYERAQPVSPSQSTASGGDMEIQSTTSSQSSCKAPTPPKALPSYHVIAGTVSIVHMSEHGNELVVASPRQKRPLTHTQRKEATKVQPTLSPQETQIDLMDKFKGLADAILDQQERYRHSQLQHVVQHNVDKFEKSLGEYANTLRARVGFHAIEAAFQDAATQHRAQVEAVKCSLDEALFTVEGSEVVDEELLSDCATLKQFVMQSGRSMLQDRMKALNKKVESCRTKRKHQMQTKLKDIKGKFNSNDLLAMQTLLGRI